MCTFCGRDHNARPKTKLITVYDGKDKYLGSYSVPIDKSVREYQRGLSDRYPTWQYTSEK